MFWVLLANWYTWRCIRVLILTCHKTKNCETLKSYLCVSAGPRGGKWSSEGEVLSPGERPPHLPQCLHAVEEQQLLQHLVQWPLYPYQGHAQGQTPTAFVQSPLAHRVHLWLLLLCSHVSFSNVLSRFQLFSINDLGFLFNSLNTGARGALPVKGHYGATEDEPGFLWVRLGYHQKMHLCCLLSPGCQAQGTSCFTLNMLHPVATGCGRFIAA